MTIQMNSIPEAREIGAVRKFFDWEPQAVSLGWSHEDGRTGEVTGKQGVIHPDGTFLGVRGEGSMPHSPRKWLIDHVETMLDDSGLRVINYGELDNWKKMYVQVATEQTETVAGVEFRPFITASTSMDGSYATCYKRNVQLIVCLNTFAIARREDGLSYSVKATKNSEFSVIRAREALEIMFEDSEDFAVEIERLTNHEVSEDRFSRFLDKWAPLPASAPVTRGEKSSMSRAEKKRDSLVELWESDDRVSPWRGTEFGVIQAVNTYEHHIKTVKNETRENRNILRTMSGEWGDVNAEAARLLATV